MLDWVGLFLPPLEFSHGQLYVAPSRARFFDNVRVEVTGKTIKTENKVGRKFCISRSDNKSRYGPES